MTLRAFHVILSFVVFGTLIPVYLHYHFYGFFSVIQAGMVFFLALNTLISLWEISLGLQINHIHATLKKLHERYGTRRLEAVGALFLAPMTVSDIISSKFWSQIWSTYGMYDPSYANKESFGFFIDVGNGWTTLLPSLIWYVAMTHHTALYPHMFTPFVLGIMGVMKFYQEFYGTCIYFLSFFLNERYKGKTFFEVALFVGFSNGLWFFFPLLGIYVSIHMIISGNYDILKSM